MGLFSNISQAQFSEGGNYLKEGVFRLEVMKVILKKTRKGPMGFIAELRIVQSSNKLHEIGSDVTWMTLDSQEPFLGNVKQFIASVSDVEMNTVDEAAAEFVVDEAQPLKGLFVRASAVNITTQKGKAFTKVKFIPDSVGDAGADQAHSENK